MLFALNKELWEYTGLTCCLFYSNFLKPNISKTFLFKLWISLEFIIYENAFSAKDNQINVFLYSKGFYPSRKSKKESDVIIYVNVAVNLGIKFTCSFKETLTVHHRKECSIVSTAPYQSLCGVEWRRFDFSLDFRKCIPWNELKWNEIECYA